MSQFYTWRIKWHRVKAFNVGRPLNYQKSIMILVFIILNGPLHELLSEHLLGIGRRIYCHIINQMVQQISQMVS